MQIQKLPDQLTEVNFVAIEYWERNSTRLAGRVGLGSVEIP